MPRIPGIRRLLHITRGRAGIERAVDDELQFHFDMTMRDLMNGGMTPDDARREAERRFGDVDRTRARLATIDRARAGQERRTEWWTAFMQDARYALRGLRLKPGFAIAVVMTLGLGLGANATMLGIVDRLLFRPPPYLIEPQRVHRLYLSRMIDRRERIIGSTGYRRFLDLREETQSFDAMTPFYSRNLAIGVGQDAREMRMGVSSADLWKMFDVKPVIGRFFTAEEDVPPNGTPVVVLSYAFWQTRFGGRSDALGTVLDIGSAKYTVIGVAPEGFQAFQGDPCAAFIPISAHMGAEGESRWATTYNMSWFEILARRKPGVSVERATADLTEAYKRSYLAQVAKSPQTPRIEVAKPRAVIGPVLKDRGPNQGNQTKVTKWLVGVAGIVLLIACANVANLLLARAIRRRREIAVRIALGVSRKRLLMQLMTESLLLAGLGAITGLAIAQWGGTLVRRAILGEEAVSSGFADQRVGLAIAVLAAMAGLLTGLAPALQAWRTDVASTLKSGSRQGGAHRSRARLALLLVQATLSVVLLVGAGLFVRSLRNVQHIRLGYDTEKLAWVEIEDRGVSFDSVQRIALREALVDRARATPGIALATRAITVPFWSTWEYKLFADGIDSLSRLGSFTLQGGTPTFFETMGTRIIRGRGITAEDRAGAPKVVVVGESMAKRIWPQQDPLGKCLRLDQATAPCMTVVGVAEDVRRGSLNEPEMHYYMPIGQFSPASGGVFVRTQGPAEAQIEELRRSLQTVMPGASYVNVMAMSKIVGPVMRSWQLGATMFTIFGGLALVLAAIGLYSVIAYSVTQRIHEMGVRVALGAQAGDVVRLIVREGMTIVVPGVVLGLATAVIAGRWVEPLLFEVSPRDPFVIGTVVATLLLVAMAASLVPATRAARVDPNEALRSD